MTNGESRRDFLRATGAGYAAWSAVGAAPAAAAGPPVAAAGAIAAEIERRARHYLAQRYLVVDYYRIRRQLAYPLPVTSLSLPEVKVPSISEYPWATWMMWALEERVHALGWAAEWTGNAEFARAAARDVEALAAWPRYCQYRQPDLSSGHAGRLLWAAATKWRWVKEPLRRKILEACARHADEVRPLAEKHYGPVRSKEDLLRADPNAKLPNIPLIGTLTAALTANVSKHAAAPELNTKVQAVLGAILDLRSKGHSEAVGYDGYVLDFVADWLESVAPAERARVLEHPNLKQYLDESYMLGAPGAIQEVAQLSDVEPREMPFHYSAQAKLAHWGANATRAWFLRQWPVDWVRADALGALRPVMAGLKGQVPAAGALDAHYAAVLRTGWAKEDTAVVVSTTTSVMSHLPPDNGTLVIGTRGRWMVSDPGYQQYMQGIERDFTLGPAAHNAPVIAGVTGSRKEARVAALERVAPDLLRVRVDLTRCYPEKAGVTAVERTVWLADGDAVVVADRIQPAAGRVDYHWHGHPEAAWWARDGWALVRLPDADLWITSPQAKLTGADIARHDGSRGQLTLGARIEPAPPVIWWVLALAAAPPAVESGAEAIRVGGREFRV